MALLPSAQHPNRSCEFNPFCQEQRHHLEMLVMAPHYNSYNSSLSAWASTLSFLHQTPQLMPRLSHSSRTMCLVTVHTGRGQPSASSCCSQGAGKTCPSYTGAFTTAMQLILVLAQICSYLLLSYTLLLNKHKKTSLPQHHHQLHRAERASE